MFNKQEFIASAFAIKDLPKEELPQVILCGRSNVGKSSFINSLFNRKNLAKTSSTPGKTRSINFYKIDDKFFIVDLPGYGYAKTSLKERAYWGNMMNDYLSISKNISLAFHFIDSRHAPTELDIKLNELLRNHQIPYVVLLNKIDKLKQSELSKARKNIIEVFPELSWDDNLFTYSSVKKIGKQKILQRLNALFG